MGGFIPFITFYIFWVAWDTHDLTLYRAYSVEGEMVTLNNYIRNSIKGNLNKILHKVRENISFLCVYLGQCIFLSVVMVTTKHSYNPERPTHHLDVTIWRRCKTIQNNILKDIKADILSGLWRFIQEKMTETSVRTFTWDTLIIDFLSFRINVCLTRI